MLPDASEPSPLDVPSDSLAPASAEIVTPDPFWNYVDVAIVFGLLIASMAIILGCVAALLAARPSLRLDPTPILLPTQLAFYAFVYLSLDLVFRYRHGRPMLSSLGWRSSSFNLWLTIPAGLLLAFLVSALSSLLHTPEVASPLQGLTNSPVMLILVGIMAVTLAPFFEELLFRGFLQPLLSRTFGIVAGIVITAAIFGGLHAPEYSYQWQYAVAITVVGIVLGWVRFKSNSIIPGIVLHGAFNTVAVVALAASKFFPTYFPTK